MVSRRANSGAGSDRLPTGLAGYQRWSVVVAMVALAGCIGEPPPEGGGVDGALGGVDAGLEHADGGGSSDAAMADARPPETIQPARIYADVAALAAAEMTGRAPGTAGNELAMAYVESAFAEIGVQPLGDGGSFRQGFSFATLVALATTTMVQTANIVGVVPGSDPVVGHEVIVIGGHLDHLGTESGEIYPGADDNASGTAVTLELARMVMGSEVAPARTLVFVGFNAEERGLIGSCYLASHFPFPIEDVVVMLSVDMVGAGNGSGINLVGGLEAGNGWFGELVAAGAELASLDYQVIDGWGAANSDHACFDQRGVSAMLVTSRGNHAYYHTPEDTIDTIHPADLEATARLIWAAIEPLARGEEQSWMSTRSRGPHPPLSSQSDPEGQHLRSGWWESMSSVEASAPTLLDPIVEPGFEITARESEFPNASVIGQPRSGR